MEERIGRINISLDSRWSGQFLTRQYSRGGSPKDDQILPAEEILDGAPDRFRSRANRRVPFTAELWKEAIEQVRLGRLDAPKQLNAEGEFSDNPRYQLNVASRFAVKQSGTIRARDDLRHSHTIKGCGLAQR